MFNINDYDLDNWNGRGFYEYIKNQYEQAAREVNIDYADVYLDATSNNDFYFGGLEIVNRLFLEILFHAQNSKQTRMDGTVHWDSNKTYIQNATCNFDPKAFLEHYHISYNDDSIYRNDFIESNKELLKNIKDDMHITSDKPLAYRFIKDVIYYAVFIVRTYSDEDGNVDNARCKNKFFDKLYGLHDITTIKQYLDSKMTFGYHVSYEYGEALLCDLLKESDTRFNYLIKPDTHLKDAFKSLFGLNDLIFEGSRIEDNEIVNAFSAIVQAIRRKGVNDINEFKLDKMIFILFNNKGFYSLNYHGIQTKNLNGFNIDKKTLLSHINNNFRINHK